MTRRQLCLEMLEEVSQLLPQWWIMGDDEMGRSSSFRRELRTSQERYLLPVLSKTLTASPAAPAFPPSADPLIPATSHLTPHKP